MWKYYTFFHPLTETILVFRRFIFHHVILYQIILEQELENEIPCSLVVSFQSNLTFTSGEILEVLKLHFLQCKMIKTTVKLSKCISFIMIVAAQNYTSSDSRPPRAKGCSKVSF